MVLKHLSLGTKISNLIYRLVTASADGTARVYNTMTGACVSILVGHEGEISKVTKLLRPDLRHGIPQTKPARLWQDSCGHDGEIFSRLVCIL